MSDQAGTTSSDENILAAISHFLGLLPAFIVWVTQKDKSRYVRFQSIQAITFHLVASVIMLLVVGLIMLLAFGALSLSIGDIAILGSQGNPTAEPARTVVALLTAVPFMVGCILVPVVGVLFVAQLVAAIQTFQGKNFHYPWLGKWVENALSK